MADAPTAPERGVTSGDPTSSTPKGSPVLRTAVAAVLALALVASLAWLVLELTRGDDENPAQERRETVMLKAREYMLAAWNFGAADLDDKKKLTTYRDRVEPLITTSFKTDFEKTLELLEPAVAQQGYSRTATVERVAVESLEDDTATVIVGGETNETVAKKKQSSPYAWSVTLQHVDGTWLVDEFTEYGSEQGAGQGTGQGGAQ